MKETINQAYEYNETLKEYIENGEVIKAIENRFNSFLEETKENLSEESYNNFFDFLQDINDDEDEVHQHIEEWIEELQEDTLLFLPTEEEMTVDFEEFAYTFLTHQVFAQEIDSYLVIHTQNINDITYKDLVSNFIHNLFEEMYATFVEHLIEHIPLFENNYIPYFGEWNLKLTSDEELTKVTLDAHPPLNLEYSSDEVEKMKQLLTSRIYMYGILVFAQALDVELPNFLQLDELTEELDYEHQLPVFSQDAFYTADEFVQAYTQFLEEKFSEF